jgi:hypothetical protein
MRRVQNFRIQIAAPSPSCRGDADARRQAETPATTLYDRAVALRFGDSERRSQYTNHRYAIWPGRGSLKPNSQPSRAHVAHLFPPRLNASSSTCRSPKRDPIETRAPAAMSRRKSPNRAKNLRILLSLPRTGTPGPPRAGHPRA